MINGSPSEHSDRPREAVRMPGQHNPTETAKPPLEGSRQEEPPGQTPSQPKPPRTLQWAERISRGQQRSNTPMQPVSAPEQPPVETNTPSEATQEPAVASPELSESSSDDSRRGARSKFASRASSPSPARTRRGDLTRSSSQRSPSRSTSRREVLQNAWIRQELGSVQDPVVALKELRGETARQVADAQGRCDDMESQCVSLVEEKERVSHELRALTEQAEGMQGKHREEIEAQDERHRVVLENLQREHRKELAIMEEKHDALREAAMHLAAKVDENDEANASQVVDEVETARQQLEAAEVTRDELEAALKAGEEELKKQQSALEEKEQKIADLTRMVEELEASKKEVVEAALALAERLEAVSGAEDEVTLLKQRIDALEVDHQGQLEKEREQAAVAGRAAVATMQAAAEHIQGTPDAAKLTVAAASLACALAFGDPAAVVKAEQAMADAEAKSHDMESRMTYAELQDQAEVARHTINQQASKISVLERRIAELSGMEQNVCTLTKAKACVDTKLQSASEHIASLEEAAAFNAIKLTETAATVSDMERQLAEAQASSQAAELEHTLALAKSNKALETAQQDHKSALQSLVIEKDELIAELREKVTELEASLMGMEAGCTGRIKALQDENARIRSGLEAEHVATIAKVRADLLAESAAALTGAEARCERLSHSCQAHKEAAEEAQKTVARLEEDMTRLRADVKALRQDGEELNCQLEESRSKLAGVQEEYQSERRKSEGIMLAQLEEHKGRMEAALAAQSVEHECALKALSATRDMQEQTKLQDVNSDWQKQMDALEAKHRSNVRTKDTEAAEALAASKKAAQNALVSARKSFEMEVEQAVMKERTRLDDAMKRQLQTVTMQKDKEAAALRKALEDAEEKHTRMLTAEEEKNSSEMIGLEERVSEYERKAGRIQADCEARIAANQAHEDKMSAAMNAMEGTMRAMETLQLRNEVRASEELSRLAEQNKQLQRLVSSKDEIIASRIQSGLDLEDEARRLREEVRRVHKTVADQTLELQHWREPEFGMAEKEVRSKWSGGEQESVYGERVMSLGGQDGSAHQSAHPGNSPAQPPQQHSSFQRVAGQDQLGSLDDGQVVEMPSLNHVEHTPNLSHLSSADSRTNVDNKVSCSTSRYSSSNNSMSPSPPGHAWLRAAMKKAADELAEEASDPVTVEPEPILSDGSVSLQAYLASKRRNNDADSHSTLVLPKSRASKCASYSVESVKKSPSPDRLEAGPSKTRTLRPGFEPAFKWSLLCNSYSHVRRLRSKGLL